MGFVCTPDHPKRVRWTGGQGPTGSSLWCPGEDGEDFNPGVLRRSHHKLGSLGQPQFVVSQFWRPRVQNHGVSRATLSLGALGRVSLAFPKLMVVTSNPRHPLAVVA